MYLMFTYLNKLQLHSQVSKMVETKSNFSVSLSFVVVSQVFVYNLTVLHNRCCRHLNKSKMWGKDIDIHHSDILQLQTGYTNNNHSIC